MWGVGYFAPPWFAGRFWGHRVPTTPETPAVARVLAVGRRPALWRVSPRHGRWCVAGRNQIWRVEEQQR